MSNYDGAEKLATKIGATNDISGLFSSHMVWALKNNQFNFDKSCTNRINFQIPLPDFTLMNFYILAQMENVKLFSILILVVTKI